MDDEARIAAAVEAEEARLARKLERSDGPRIGTERRERERLLSVIAEVALDLDADVADELAVRLLDNWSYDVARRAVEVYGARPRPRFDPEDVHATADALVEADRIATIRRRAREGDPEAARELVAIKRALRRAVP